jgi:hypothetical protein
MLQSYEFSAISANIMRFSQITPIIILSVQFFVVSLHKENIRSHKAHKPPKTICYVTLIPNSQTQGRNVGKH